MQKKRLAFAGQTFLLFKGLISTGELIIYLLICSLIFFVTSLGLNKPNEIRRSDYLPPPVIVKNLTSGLNIQLADSFWVRSLQDFDHCDDLINERECKGQSWLFKIIDLTTDLDRKFYEAYYFGGLALTVIISDYEGASKIFDKGTEAFPNNWQLNYAAAYHVIFEEKNKPKAIKLYLAAVNNGAPNWVRVLAGRLAAESGEQDLAADILKHMIETSEEPRLIERLKKKLGEIENQSVKKK